MSTWNTDDAVRHTVGLNSGGTLMRSLARLLDLSPDGIFLIERGRIRLGNRFLSDCGGYRREEVDSTCFASFFDAECAPAVEALCRPHPGGDPPLDMSAVLICKNGGRLAVRLRAEGCRFHGHSCVLVIVEPQGQTDRNDGWDSELEGYFGSEDPLPAPACA
jgi:PAS domain-containing protein